MTLDNFRNPFLKSLTDIKTKVISRWTKRFDCKGKMFFVSTFLAIIYFYVRKKFTLVAFANGLSSPTFWEQFAFE